MPPMMPGQPNPVICAADCGGFFPARAEGGFPPIAVPANTP